MTAVTDNTDQLQAMLKSGPCAIPAGDWYVDVTRGLVLPSGCQLVVNGTLRAIPTDVDWSHILFVNDVEDVSITLNGRIYGEGHSHLSAAGTGHGMGVMIQNANAWLYGGGSISGCWGDGIYVIGANAHVSVIGVNSVANRRNGMSVVCCAGVTARNAAFNYNGGQDPQCGIDLEPDDKSEFIRNVDIDYCQFIGNAGASIQLGFGAAPKSNFQNIKIGSHNIYKGKPINGLTPFYANLGYATCRWLWFYDWWGFPRTLSI